jgi:hypothetical protein
MIDRDQRRVAQRLGHSDQAPIDLAQSVDLQQLRGRPTPGVQVVNMVPPPTSRLPNGKKSSQALDASYRLSIGIAQKSSRSRAKSWSTSARPGDPPAIFALAGSTTPFSTTNY